MSADHPTKFDDPYGSARFAERAPTRKHADPFNQRTVDECSDATVGGSWPGRSVHELAC